MFNVYYTAPPPTHNHLALARTAHQPSTPSPVLAPALSLVSCLRLSDWFLSLSILMSVSTLRSLSILLGGLGQLCE